MKRPNFRKLITYIHLIIAIEWLLIKNNIKASCFPLFLLEYDQKNTILYQHRHPISNPQDRTIQGNSHPLSVCQPPTQYPQVRDQHNSQAYIELVQQFTLVWKVFNKIGHENREKLNF